MIKDVVMHQVGLFMVAASGVVPASENALVIREGSLPAIITREGAAAIFAAEEFFYGKDSFARLEAGRSHQQFEPSAEALGHSSPY